MRLKLLDEFEPMLRPNYYKEDRILPLLNRLDVNMGLWVAVKWG